jgi:drug/metabolite transporter (DMT)-like permease
VSRETAPSPPSPAARPESARGPWLAFAGCSTIWGSTFLFISIGNDSLAPIWAATLRLGLATLVLLAIMRLTRQPLPRGPALAAAMRYGIFQFGVNFPLLYWGEKTVPSGLTAVLFATIPLSSALITLAFGMERFNPIKMAGAIVAIGGVAVIGRGGGGATGHFLGMLAVLGAATFAALGTTLLKRGPRQSPFGANAVGSAVGFVICLPVSRLLGEPWVIPHTAPAVFSLAYLVLAGSAGAFAMMAWLIHRWPVTRVGFISVVVPVVAMLLGVAVRHEPLTGASLLGSALVLTGLGIGMAADGIASRRSAGAAAH